PVDVEDFNFPTILSATIQCVLANAAQSPSIKFVAVRIVGVDDYRNYGGVYTTTKFRDGPGKRRFKPL
ncbi:MAG: hypothetical protein IT348_13695, partial [Candidatus Eisenbacteria bacterium]|nr:hypothetical protein [Candidatus Eisenbacteria bacterium]